jgi:hypothetical protein
MWQSSNLLSTRGEGKAVPLRASSGPEGSRKLRFPDFMTMAQDGGKVVSLMHRPHLPWHPSGIESATCWFVA